MDPEIEIEQAISEARKRDQGRAIRRPRSSPIAPTPESKIDRSADDAGEARVGQAGAAQGAGSRPSQACAGARSGIVPLPDWR